MKAKYNQLASGNKVPSSLTAMESQVKKTQAALDELIIKKTNLVHKGISESDSSIINLDNQIIKLEKHLVSLDTQMNDLKLNPQASIEAQNLKAKINLAEESIKNAKNEADGLVKKIEKTGNAGFSNLSNSIKSVGGGITRILIGKKGLSGGIDNISSKLDKFKSRITKMIGTVMVFRLLRNSLTSISNGFMGMLKSNKSFANSLNQIKVNLMTAFAPIYNYVLPAINTLMNALSQVTGSIAKFMASIFGQTASQAKKNAKELYNQANAQNAVNKAEEGSIASFDKLEVNSDEGNTNGPNNLDFSKDIKTSTYLDNLLTDLKNKIGNGLWFDAGSRIAEDLNNVIEKIDIKGFFAKGKEIATNLCEGINGFVSTFDWKQLAVKVSDGFKGLGDLILATIKTIDWQAVGKAIGDFILNIDWFGIIKQIIDIMLSTKVAILDLVIGLLDSVIDAITSPDFLDKIRQGGVNIFLGLVNGIGSVFSKIGELFMKIIDLFKNLFGIHSPSTVFEEFGRYIIEGLINGIKGLTNSVVQLFQLLLDSIKNIWNGVTSWFNSTVIQPLINLFLGIWSSLITGAQNAWSGIKNVFSSVASFFQDTFSNAWSKVKSVFSTGGKIFDGIKEGIISAFTNVVNAIIRGINKVISVPFNGINTALKKIKNIDILGAKPFKGIINTISVPQIPMLAQGAVIPPNAKFLAMLGDQKNGRNLEAPESLIRKIVREESGAERENVFNGTFIIQCDVEEIGRASIKGVRLIESKTGETYYVN